MDSTSLLLGSFGWVGCGVGYYQKCQMCLNLVALGGMGHIINMENLP